MQAEHASSHRQSREAVLILLYCCVTMPCKYAVSSTATLKPQKRLRQHWLSSIFMCHSFDKLSMCYKSAAKCRATHTGEMLHCVCSNYADMQVCTEISCEASTHGKSSKAERKNLVSADAGRAHEYAQMLIATCQATNWYLGTDAPWQVILKQAQHVILQDLHLVTLARCSWH